MSVFCINCNNHLPASHFANIKGIDECHARDDKKDFVTGKDMPCLCRDVNTDGKCEYYKGKKVK